MYCNVVLYVFALILSLHITTVQSDSKIIKPGAGGDPGDYEDNPRYPEGTDITFKWLTDIKNVKVIVWQDYPTPGDGKFWWDMPLTNGGKNGTTTWKAKPLGITDGLKDNEDVVFYYGLYETDSENRDEASHYFNITRVKRLQATGSVTVNEKKPVPTASQAHAPPVSSPALPSYGNDDLSCGAIAGISVGATIGGIILLGGLGFLAGRQFQKAFNRAQEHDQETLRSGNEKPASTPETMTSQFTPHSYQSQPQYAQQTQYQPQQQWQPPVEAPVPRVWHEAP